MKLIDGDDLLEHAEANGESEEFINKLSDYIKDAPRVNDGDVLLIYRDDLGLVIHGYSKPGKELIWRCLNDSAT